MSRTTSRRLITLASALSLAAAAAAPATALASAKKATRLSVAGLTAVAPGTSELVSGQLTTPGNGHGVKAARLTLSFVATALMTSGPWRHR